MNISRDNYEEFFLLYTDNELNTADRKIVEEFVQNNPDLAKELELFQQFKLSSSEQVIFTGKESLLKPETNKYDIASNYEAFFVLYADDELNVEKRIAVEEFVYRNPQFQTTFKLIQQAKLTSDTAIVFENKELLYRKEEDDKVVPFRWWKLAAAALVLLLLGFLWLNNGSHITRNELVKKENSVKPAERTVTPVLHTAETNTEKNKISQSAQNESLAVSKEKTSEQKDFKNSSTPRVKNQQESIAQNKQVQQVYKKQQTELPVQNNSATGNDLARADIPSIQRTNRAIEIKKDMAATIGPDQPSIFNTDENDKSSNVSYASATDDNVEVLNTTVNKKNSLRGLLRKASRLIAKKTERADDAGNRKGILIGGFEIALK